MPVSQFHLLLHAIAQRSVKPSLLPLIKRMTEAPKFVFSRDVVDFVGAHMSDYGDAIAAANRAGHCELPHNPMLVEWQRASSGRHFWLIRGGQGVGHYQLSCALLDNDGRGWVINGHQPIDVAGTRWRAGRFFWYDGQPDGADDDDWTDFEAGCASAFFFAMAVHVRGIITRPAVAIDTKVEAARFKRGLPATTRDYVTVHIGYITDRDGTRHAYTEGLGRHVRVHLRRGHTRNQPCGPRWQDRKEVWIPPVLVNYVPGVKVHQPDYLVVP
jgi:hypothetical protein